MKNLTFIFLATAVFSINAMEERTGLNIEFEGKQHNILELIEEASSTPAHPFNQAMVFEWFNNKLEYKGFVQDINDKGKEEIKKGTFLYNKDVHRPLQNGKWAAAGAIILGTKAEQAAKDLGDYYKRILALSASSFSA